MEGFDPDSNESGTAGQQIKDSTKEPALQGSKATKPSEDNQRHSNKVESIEVLINRDFIQSDMMPQPVVVQDDQMQGVASQGGQVEFVPSLGEVRLQPHDPLTYAPRIDRRQEEINMEYDFAGEDFAHHHPIGVDVEVDFGQGKGGPPVAGTSSLFADEDHVDGNLVQAADSGQNDKRFYSLIELAAMEPDFERKFCDGGHRQLNQDSSSASCGREVNNSHVLLSPQEYRAKLYWLDQENRWKDIGTGRFRLLLSKDGEEHYIQVVSEDCIDDQIALDGEIDKVVDGMVTSSAENAQSPQGLNGASGGVNHPAKHVFLHRCFVQCLHDFSRQGDTIITWQDDYKNEFALSFQDEKGAQNTWWSICFLKGIQINQNIDEPNEAGGSSETNSIGNGVILPTKENLSDLVNELISQDAYTRRNIAEQVLKQEESIARGGNNNGASSEMSERDHSKLQIWRSLYLDKLQKIFNEVEQQYHKAIKAMEENTGDEHDRFIHLTQQVNNLHSLFQIFRNLLNLNQSELLEVLLNENYWMTTFGALEYDPEVFSPLGYKFDNQEGGNRSPVMGKPMNSLTSSPNSNARSYGNYDHFDQANQFNVYLTQEADFREFLSKKVKFKQAVTISDPQVTYSIHLSYKLQYLKDTAMARFIDENTSHTIMQLISQLHQIILDYIFGEDFDRIQKELILKMRDNSNVEDKENALKFFLEICTLLKSINLTNRQLQMCNSAFTKIMLVLAQIFDIMIPDRHTLLAEVQQDKEGLIRIYEQRAKIAQDKAQKTAADAKDNATPATINAGSKDQDTAEKKIPSGSEEEIKDATVEALAVAPLVTPEKSNEQKYDDFGGETNTPDAGGAGSGSGEKVTPDCTINPGRETLEEYLKSPHHSEDPSMTQIDILKSNSIEIFYNLLMLLNNVNTSTIRDFLCSENQKKQGYVFLRHLAHHMIFTSQQGIKVSICEFFKDLTSKETSEMQKNFQQIILFHVVSHFVNFLGDEDNGEGRSGSNDNNDMEMKDEELKSQESRSLSQLDPKIQEKYRKQIDNSRILILQFLNKLITDNVDSYGLRHFFINNKVLIKVANCHTYKSIQTNVEIIKFFKAIIQSKDTMSVSFMIKKSIFETILEMFLANKTKGNLLHSCILNLFDMLTPAEVSVNSAGGTTSMIGVMGLDSGYGSVPKTEGGFVQFNLLQKLYQRLNDNGFVKRVFFHKKYEDGFRKFNRYLRQVLDFQPSEHDSKQASDRDRSNSHSQHKMYHDTSGNLKFQAGGRTSGQELGQGQNPFEIPVNVVKQEDTDEDPEYDELEKFSFVPQHTVSNKDYKQESAAASSHDNGGKSGEAKNAADGGMTFVQILGVINQPSGKVDQADDDGAEDHHQQLQQTQKSCEADQSNVAMDSEMVSAAEKAEEPSHATAKYQTPSSVEAHSNRAARAMSPMSGHVGTKSGHQYAGSGTHFYNDKIIELGQGQNSPEIEKSPKPAGRRLSSDDGSLGMQKSGSGKLIAPPSDEANGSNKGGNNKSALSETVSNPDLDEYFFNKHTPGSPGLQFAIGSGNVTPQGLHFSKQESPNTLAKQSSLEIKDGTGSPIPLRKINSKGERVKKPKFERARRAQSENPPPRTELVKLTFQEATQEKEREEEAALQRLLDAKLSETLADKEVVAPVHVLRMSRSDSVVELEDTVKDQIGKKRQRQDEQGDQGLGDGDNDDEARLQEQWMSKRPRLEKAEGEQEQEAAAQAKQQQDKDEGEKLKKLLDAYGVNESKKDQQHRETAD